MTPGHPGILLPEHRLALDCARPGYDTLISHGHGDHVPWDPEEPVGTWKPSLAPTWCTPETGALIQARFTPRPHLTTVPYGEPFELNGCTVTFQSAGHILGSALIHIDTPKGSVLYTGDFKMGDSRTCASAQPMKGDVLVMETTFGLPIFIWEPREALEERLVQFAQDTLAEGATPVYLAYALGKGQEVVKILGEHGVETSLHGAVQGMCDVYERFGCSFPLTSPYEKGTLAGKALVCPPSFRLNPMVTKLRDYRIAYVSGWASLENRRAQMDADGLIPLSDHADFPGLLQLVREVAPQQVFTVHGYTEPFSDYLRKQGVAAQPLTTTESRGEE